MKRVFDQQRGRKGGNAHGNEHRHRQQHQREQKKDRDVADIVKEEVLQHRASLRPSFRRYRIRR